MNPDTESPDEIIDVEAVSVDPETAPPLRPVVVIQSRPWRWTTALLPPTLVLLIAFAIFSFRFQSPDWRGLTQWARATPPPGGPKASGVDPGSRSEPPPNPETAPADPSPEPAPAPAPSTGPGEPPPAPAALDPIESQEP